MEYIGKQFCHDQRAESCVGYKSNCVLELNY